MYIILYNIKLYEKETGFSACVCTYDVLNYEKMWKIHAWPSGQIRRIHIYARTTCYPIAYNIITQVRKSVRIWRAASQPGRVVMIIRTSGVRNCPQLIIIKRRIRFWILYYLFALWRPFVSVGRRKKIKHKCITCLMRYFINIIIFIIQIHTNCPKIDVHICILIRIRTKR